MTIVCFGDSITGARPGNAYLHAYLKWPDILGALLEAVGGEPVTVWNAGYAGDATEALAGRGPGALARLDGEVLARRPDVCVILLGANDAAVAHAHPEDSDAEARFAANLATIVSRVQASGTRVLLLQYHEARAATPEAAWSFTTRFNPIIARVGRECDVPVLNMEPALAAARGRFRPAELLDPADGTHLRPAGELVYAQTVLAALREYFPAIIEQRRSRSEQGRA